MDEQIDPQVKALTQAIRHAETGGSKDPYNTPGKSGEFGAYQFMPDTYRGWAKQYLGDENAPPTVENQNKIAYSQVKSWKDQGYSPAEIASMWNSGRADAYKQGVRGVNRYGAEYDVPGYTKKVSDYYQHFKGQPAQIGQVSQSGTPTGGNLNPQDIEQQKKQLEAQGQPTSVLSTRAEPTGAGKLIRGLIKDTGIPSAIVNIASAGALLGKGGVEKSNKIAQEGLNNKYLGNVKGIGIDPNKTMGGNFLNAAGHGATAASLVAGGGEAKAGFEIAKTGKLFTQGLLKTAGKGALEGAGIGAIGGTGVGLKEDDNAGEVAVKALGGAALGGALGGIFGTVGGVIARNKGITQETINAAKSALSKDYTDSLGATVQGRNILRDSKEGMQASLDAGILPDVTEGHYDTSNASDTLQDMMDKLGEGRGADISAQNRVADTNALRQKVIKNASDFNPDPKRNPSVKKFINEWFDNLGDNVDLNQLNKLQVEVGRLSKFANETDAINRSAYRSLYHGIGDYINDVVKHTGGVNKEINETLTRYHKIMDFLDSIHGKKVADKGLVNILASHGARTIATGVGGTVGGGPGAIIANESLPILQKFLKKILGADNSSYQAVMDAIRSGEQKQIDDILSRVEQNKGLKIMRDIQRGLEEIKQLPASTLPKGKTSENYVRTLLRGTTTYEKPAQSIVKVKSGVKGLLKMKGDKPNLYEPYTPTDKLPVIKSGKTPKRKSKLPTIKF